MLVLHIRELVGSTAIAIDDATVSPISPNIRPPTTL